MPIVEIRALPPTGGDVPEALGRVCSAVAAAAGCRERAVWATWETVEPGHYLEGREAATAQPHATHPPLVRVLLFEGRDAAAVRAILAAAARALAEALGLEPGNVFVHAEELKAGRVHSGGSILE